MLVVAPVPFALPGVIVEEFTPLIVGLAFAPLMVGLFGLTGRVGPFGTAGSVGVIVFGELGRLAEGVVPVPAGVVVGAVDPAGAAHRGTAMARTQIKDVNFAG